MHQPCNAIQPPLFGGQDIGAQGQACTKKEKELCGYQEDGVDKEVQEMLNEAWAKGVNARQCVAAIKGPYGGGCRPTFPDEVQGNLPSEPNVYGDGSLKCPTNQWWAIGGYGLWWPKQIEGCGAEGDPCPPEQGCTGERTASAGLTPRAPCQVARRIAITPAAAGNQRKRRSTKVKKKQRGICKVPKGMVKMIRQSTVGREKRAHLRQVRGAQELLTNASANVDSHAPHLVIKG